MTSEFHLIGIKELLTDVANVLMLKVINNLLYFNKVKIILMSFVHHNKLQKFLIAPHKYYLLTYLLIYFTRTLFLILTLHRKEYNA